jgi:hypothetical protein
MSVVHILAIAGLTALSLAVVVVPVALPWPRRLRWTVASNGDAWAASGWAAAGYVLSEASVDAVWPIGSSSAVPELALAGG